MYVVPDLRPEQPSLPRTGEQHIDSRVRDLVGELTAMVTCPVVPAELLHGTAIVAERIRWMEAGARVSFDTLHQDPTEVRAPIGGPRSVIRHRTVFNASALTTAAGVARLRAAGDAGDEVRLLRALPLTVAIADGAGAIVAVHRTQGVVGTALGPSPLLDGIAALFETVWRQAIPYQVGTVTLHAHHDHHVSQLLDDVDRHLLLLLAGGATETAVARRTGLSVRTVQRRLARLAERLDATTRFQMAVHAAKRGWI